MQMIAVHYDWLGVCFDQIPMSLLPLALPVFAPMLALHKFDRTYRHDGLGWYTSGFV